MDHLTDYARWMENVPFGSEISDLDAMIMCYLTYADLAPLPGRGITLRDAVAAMEEREIPCLIASDDPLFSDRVRMIAAGHRFGDLVITDFVDERDDEKGIQFSATVFRSPFWSFLAFRGTDQSLVGWREDFIMSFTVMPSQVRASEYAREWIDGGKWYMGGHSKGGNLALYAACAIGEKQRALVERVYLLDSPGLCREALEGTGVDPDAARDRLVRIIPEYDVVGSLFAPGAPRETVVRSDYRGLMQHDMASWGVDHGSLMTAEKRDPVSLMISEATGKWLDRVDRQAREEFVDSLFEQLGKGGKKTLRDVTAEGLLGYESIVIGMLRKREGRSALGRFPLKESLERAEERLGKKLKRLLRLRESILQCFGLIMLGAVFTLVNERLLETSAGIFLTVLAAGQDILTARRLVKKRSALKEQSPYVALSLFVTALVLCMLFKEHAAFLLGSIGVSTCLWVMGFHCFGIFTGRKKSGFYRWIRLPEALILFYFGAAFLTVPHAEAGVYVYSLGLIMVLDGLVRLVRILLGDVLRR
ncbi:MAG: DUF2974 domain-containing protein [Clostridia bacterium]|nr:DUF2974 domain-containing protein [Clostridia bacterium]